MQIITLFSLELTYMNKLRKHVSAFTRIANTFFLQLKVRDVHIASVFRGENRSIQLDLLYALKENISLHSLAAAFTIIVVKNSIAQPAVCVNTSLKANRWRNNQVDGNDRGGDGVMLSAARGVK